MVEAGRARTDAGAMDAVATIYSARPVRAAAALAFAATEASSVARDGIGGAASSGSRSSSSTSPAPLPANIVANCACTFRKASSSMVFSSTSPVCVIERLRVQTKPNTLW